MPQIHLNLDRNLIFGERKKYVFTCIAHIYIMPNKNDPFYHRSRSALEKQK